MNRVIAQPMAQARRGLQFALSELGQVLKEWLAGRGNLIGLLVAWYEVVAGRVATE